MGLKIQNSGLPPMKVLIAKKLHILGPAIEYMQQISKPKKVRLFRCIFCIITRQVTNGCSKESLKYEYCLICVWWMCVCHTFLCSLLNRKQFLNISQNLWD